MKEYSLGLGASGQDIPHGVVEGNVGVALQGVQEWNSGRGRVKPQKPKTYFENKILKHCSCIRHHSSIGIAFCTSI